MPAHIYLKCNSSDISGDRSLFTFRTENYSFVMNYDANNSWMYVKVLNGEERGEDLYSAGESVELKKGTILHFHTKENESCIFLDVNQPGLPTEKYTFYLSDNAISGIHEEVIKDSLSTFEIGISMEDKTDELNKENYNKLLNSAKYIGSSEDTQQDDAADSPEDQKDQNDNNDQENSEGSDAPGKPVAETDGGESSFALVDSSQKSDFGTDKHHGDDYTVGLGDMITILVGVCLFLCVGLCISKIVRSRMIRKPNPGRPFNRNKPVKQQNFGENPPTISEKYYEDKNNQLPERLINISSFVIYNTKYRPGNYEDSRVIYKKDEPSILNISYLTMDENQNQNVLVVNAEKKSQLKTMSVVLGYFKDIGISAPYLLTYGPSEIGNIYYFEKFDFRDRYNTPFSNRIKILQEAFDDFDNISDEYELFKHFIKDVVKAHGQNIQQAKDLENIINTIDGTLLPTNSDAKRDLIDFLKKPLSNASSSNALSSSALLNVMSFWIVTVVFRNEPNNILLDNIKLFIEGLRKIDCVNRAVNFSIPQNSVSNTNTAGNTQRNAPSSLQTGVPAANAGQNYGAHPSRGANPSQPPPPHPSPVQSQQQTAPPPIQSDHVDESQDSEYNKNSGAPVKEYQQYHQQDSVHSDENVNDASANAGAENQGIPFDRMDEYLSKSKNKAKVTYLDRDSGIGNEEQVVLKYRSEVYFDRTTFIAVNEFLFPNPILKKGLNSEQGESLRICFEYDGKSPIVSIEPAIIEQGKDNVTYVLTKRGKIHSS